jgi:hypothetical protein
MALARFAGSISVPFMILGFRFAPPQALRCRPLRGLPINLTQHNVQRSDDRNHVRDQVTDTHLP